MTRIAIDFGTTRTKVAYWSEKKNESVLWHLGANDVVWIPSIFYIGKDKSYLIGEDAEAMLATDPAGVVSTLKRKLRRRQILCSGQQTEPRFLLEKLFRTLRDRISEEVPEFGGAAPEQVVLTVPATMAEEEKDVLRQAASAAGFVEVDLIPEPVAAARAWLRQDPDGKNEYAIVLDCGGGTVDWAVVAQSSGGFELVPEFAPGGLRDLGGEDIDDAIMEMVRDKVESDNFEADIPGWRAEAKQLKEGFCRTGRGGDLRLGRTVVGVPAEELSALVNKVFVERVCTAFSEYSRRVTKGLGIECPTVLLVGGSGRVSGLRKAIEESCTCRTLWWEHSDFATVLGAVVCHREVPTDAHDDVGEISNLVSEARTALEEIKEDSDAIDTASTKCLAAIAAARSSYNFGVLGESKAGKSTLINAIAGDSLSFVDVTEATPILSVYRQGAARCGTIHFRSSPPFVSSPEEINSVISKHREDVEWIATVDFAEFTSPGAGLLGLEIWDAPGFGASSYNEELVSKFLDSVSGALWVLDATLLGQSLVVGPLSRLKKAGKRVIAVVNRIDELEEDEIPQSCEYVEKTLDPYIDGVAPISAKIAFEATSAGNNDEYLERLRQTIKREILSRASSDRVLRIRRATGIGCVAVADEINRSVIALRDKTGLLDHVRHNLETAKDFTLQRLPLLIAEACSQLYKAELIEMRQQLLKIKSAKEGGSAEKLGAFIRTLRSVSEDSAGVCSAEDAASLLSSFEEDTTIEKAWEQITHGIIARTENEWQKYSRQALTLSSAAVPCKMKMPHAAAVVSESDVRQEYLGKVENDGSTKAAAVTAASSASILAAVAAASAAVAWPVVLAAIPIGLGTKFFTKRYSKKELTREVCDYTTIIGIANNRIEDKRQAIVNEATRIYPGALRAVLEDKMRGIVSEAASRILGTADETTVRVVMEVLATSKRGLLTLAQDSLGSAEAVSSTSFEENLTVDTGPSGRKQLSQLMFNNDGRLDIVLNATNCEIVDLLMMAKAHVQVRIIANGDREHIGVASATLKKALSAWGGRADARYVCSKGGPRLPMTQSMIIMDHETYVSRESLSDLLKSRVLLSRFDKGRLASERLFAELWEGWPGPWGEVLVMNI